MMLRRSLVALTVAAFLSPTLALAAPPSDADRATARALAGQAHTAFDKKDFATAADDFARADALVHAPTLMLGLARSQIALGKLVAANESLQRILREGLPADASKVFTDALEDARKELAALSPRLSWITVTVKVTGTPGHEGESKVMLDGVEVPSAAIGVPRAVDPGKHVATAMIVGGGKAEASVTVDEGKSQTVPLSVEAPPPGAVTTGPIVNTPGPDGSSTAVPKPPPPPPSTTRRNVAFASLGVGAAGLVVGAVTGGLVLSKHGTLADGCPNGKCPPSLQSDLDSYNTMGLVSTVGFIAGGVLAGVGIVLIATAPKRPSVGFRVGPTVGGGVFSAAGSF